jgi:hypothetical protein
MKAGTKKNYKCIYCRRIFAEKVEHTCKGVLRIKNLKFIDRYGYTWERGWVKTFNLNQKWRKYESKK